MAKEEKRRQRKGGQNGGGRKSKTFCVSKSDVGVSEPPNQTAIATYFPKQNIPPQGFILGVWSAQVTGSPGYSPFLNNLGPDPMKDFNGHWLKI